jgi:hypothetical protein
MLPDFTKRRGSVLRRLDGSFRLVLLGLLLLGVIHLANAVAMGQRLDGLMIANSFYGVLAYYAVMLGSARCWLPALSRMPYPILFLLAGLPVLWLCWQVVLAFLPPRQLQSVLEWPRLMLMAGYNVFKMTAVASAGMAVELWFAGQRDTRRAALVFTTAGGLGAILSILTLIEAHGVAPFAERDSPFFISLPGLVFYLCFAVLLVGLGLGLLSAWDRWSRLGRLPLQLLLVIGGLALPIYVFHGMVILGRNLLATLGMPAAFALLTTMGLFLASMALSGRWLMYFS